MAVAPPELDYNRAIVLRASPQARAQLDVYREKTFAELEAMAKAAVGKPVVESELAARVNESVCVVDVSRNEMLVSKTGPFTIRFTRDPKKPAIVASAEATASKL